MKRMRSVRLWAVAAVLALAVPVYAGYKWLEDPRSQLFGKTLVSGSPQVRVVALTFDDGPNPPYTDRILDVLEAEHIHATFFVVGRAVAAYPAVAARIVRDGNAIGNHTWDHAHLLVLDARPGAHGTAAYGRRDLSGRRRAHPI